MKTERTTSIANISEVPSSPVADAAKTAIGADITHTQSFRKPASKEWEPLNILTSISEEKKRNQSEQAEDSLKNVLLQSLQMQHLAVLAGSGCSLHAGCPSMGNLWEDIVKNPPSAEANAAAKSSGYNISQENKNIEEFLSNVEFALAIKNDSETKEFLSKAQDIILKKCSTIPNREKLSAHETFLHRLSRRRTRDQRLKVFTTNYDLCFERAAANVGCVAIDGFSFMAPRQYDPRFFNYDIVRRSRSGEDKANYLEGVFRLYKLHGSVNWEKSDNGIVEKEISDSEKACLIYPARGKYQQSYNQPFIESISQYLAAIREPNTCVLVVGFGFNDDHLSEPLLSAVRSNSHLRLIIVDPQLVKNGKTDEERKKNKYLRVLFELNEKGEDVWFVNETFEQFSKRIPDLKSLTPAERLLKDFKGLAKSYE